MCLALLLGEQRRPCLRNHFKIGTSSSFLLLNAPGSLSTEGPRRVPPEEDPNCPVAVRGSASSLAITPQVCVVGAGPPPSPDIGLAKQGQGRQQAAKLLSLGKGLQGGWQRRMVTGWSGQLEPVGTLRALTMSSKKRMRCHSSWMWLCLFLMIWFSHTVSCTS